MLMYSTDGEKAVFNLCAPLSVALYCGEVALNQTCILAIKGIFKE